MVHICISLLVFFIFYFDKVIGTDYLLPVPAVPPTWNFIGGIERLFSTYLYNNKTINVNNFKRVSQWSSPVVENP